MGNLFDNAKVVPMPSNFAAPEHYNELPSNFAAPEHYNEHKTTLKMTTGYSNFDSLIDA
jgi:hypothetical protein